MQPSDRDVGDVAVLEDRGVLISPANTLDLANRGVRFVGAGTYSVTRLALPASATAGTPLSLGDDAATRVTLPFGFSFYGREYSEVFVNSDGNLTFGRGDVATDARSLGRVLSGAPRVAPFFADLDPSKGGGIFVSAAPDALTVTWCEVPDFDPTGKVTVQASLLADGAVEVRLDASTTLEDAVVALSPGATGAALHPLPTTRPTERYRLVR